MKSTIIDAISFGLFGKAFRGIKKPSLINSINQRDSVIEISFKIGQDNYNILRGQKPHRFEVYKNDNQLNETAAISDMQKHIEMQILGFDFATFGRVIVMSSMNYTPFLLLSANERRQFVETMLGLSVFTEMNKQHKTNYSLPEKITGYTISKDNLNKYWISFTYKINLPYSISGTGKQCGIDLGIKEFATTSDNEVINNPKFYRKYEQRLIKAQRKLSKRKKGSNNRNKQRLKVNKWHKKITNCRIDFLQKLSNQLICNYDIISMEDLASGNMMKNHKLAKSIADASFFEFNRELEYKARWNYKLISRIDRFYPSSKLCHECGSIKKDLKLSDRIYVCECGYKEDRDYNASLNLRDAKIYKIAN